MTYALATAFDAISSPWIGYGQGWGVLFPFGTTTVTVNARDAVENVASCTFDVTVVDSTPPQLQCRSQVVLQAGTSGSATVEAAAAARWWGTNWRRSPRRTAGRAWW